MSAAPINSTKLLRTHEAIPKDHAGFHSQILREFLQRLPVFFALIPQDMRMGDAGNHVHDIAVTRQDTREELE